MPPFRTNQTESPASAVMEAIPITSGVAEVSTRSLKKPPKTAPPATRTAPVKADPEPAIAPSGLIAAELRLGIRNMKHDSVRPMMGMNSQKLGVPSPR